uniref:Uncharacterized protein n=1 Tax=Cyprinodon variegatus TaxID=28743 RepID=A0A3Q2DQ43_CYPVA
MFYIKIIRFCPFNEHFKFTKSPPGTSHLSPAHTYETPLLGSLFPITPFHSHVYSTWREAGSWMCVFIFFIHAAMEAPV